jgi:hypothetical protein
VLDCWGPAPACYDVGSLIGAVVRSGLHPARQYQPSTGPVKGSKILWPGRLRLHLPVRAPGCRTAKASWKSLRDQALDSSRSGR